MCTCARGCVRELPTVRLIFILPLGSLPLIWLSVDCVHLEVCVVTIKKCLRLYNKEQSRAWEWACVRACSLSALGTDTGFQTTLRTCTQTATVKLIMCPIIRVHRGDGGMDGRMDEGMRQQGGSDSFHPCCVLLLSSLAGKAEWKRVTSGPQGVNRSSVDSPQKDVQTASQPEEEKQQHDGAIRDIRHENWSHWLGRSNTNMHYITFPVIHHHWTRADSEISASDSISICRKYRSF